MDQQEVAKTIELYREQITDKEKAYREALLQNSADSILKMIKNQITVLHEEIARLKNHLTNTYSK
jgi:uncharacterized small protein (DUF1192 family)